MSDWTEWPVFEEFIMSAQRNNAAMVFCPSKGSPFVPCILPSTRFVGATDRVVGVLESVRIEGGPRHASDSARSL